MVPTDNSHQVRLDFHISDKNFGFARVSQMWVYDSQPVAGTIESNVSNYHVYNFGGGFTHLFTPNLLVDIRGGAMLKPYVLTPRFQSLKQLARRMPVSRAWSNMVACTSTLPLPLAIMGVVGTMWEAPEIHNAAIPW